MSSIGDIALFIAAIVLLIIVHEIGHFVASKLLNVEVEEFGLGFPPRAATLFTYKGTRYTLNWLPLGGFVLPKGENDPTIEGGLAAASPWVRLGVLFAGPLMNLLTAAILFSIIFLRVGVPDQSQILIVGIDEDSPAKTVGLEVGDLLIGVNDISIDGSATLSAAIRDNVGLDTLIIVDRDGSELSFNMVPRENPPPGRGALGISYSNPSQPASIGSSLANGVGAVFDQSVLLLSIPAQIIRGSVASEDARLVGYKGMYDLYQAVSSTDEEIGAPAGTGALAFFASISVSLGLLNLLPIPALDGGRILFVLPEILFRRRIPQHWANAVNFVSISLLIMLMLYINIQDFVNPAVFR